jgi:geranylgeranyl pyrophosphate synthase
MRENLKKILKNIKILVDKKLNELIPEDGNKLTEAVRYSLFSGGKRLRPMLVIETAKLLGVESKDVIISACAIEMLHTYSLIHDDLPAMDNDDYRRGKLSSHKKFDEETAILAGDSLLTMSFEILSGCLKETSAEKRCKMIEILSRAGGYKGMCLGQSMDLAYEKSGKLKSKEEAGKINKLKTGALFRACVEIGCVLGNATEIEQKSLVSFAENFGQAFQLRDDLEDGEIDKESIEIIKEKIHILIDNCFENLKVFNESKTECFKELARFCIS